MSHERRPLALRDALTLLVAAALLLGPVLATFVPLGLAWLVLVQWLWGML